MTLVYLYLFKRTFEKWLEDDGITYSAALSFHTIIGLPSLMLFTLFMGSIFLKEHIDETFIVTDVSLIADDMIVKTLNALFMQLEVTGTMNLTVLASFLIYLLSAGNIFFQLQKMINRMWGFKASKSSWNDWLNQLIRKRLSSLAAVIAFGAIVILSTLSELVLFVISDNIESTFYISMDIFRYAGSGISFIALILLFMYIFRVLPQASFGFKYIFTGSLLTVILLTIGKYMMGLYLSYANISTIYGTLGSLIAVLIWIYMSSIIVTFMAEFTGIYSRSGT